MNEINFIQTSPTELADLINEGLKNHVENLINQFSEQDKTAKDFLTRKETANFFGVSLVTLHDWNKKGLITPLKMGNRTYYERSTLVKSLLNSNNRAS